MKVLVCGLVPGRIYGSIYRALWELIQERGHFVVIYGAARGADRVAGAAARRLGLEVLEIRRTGSATVAAPGT